MVMKLENLILTVVYAGIFAIVFAESGLLFGIFLPGDSLLLTAGLLASRGYLNVFYLLLFCSIAAIGGDSVGYWFGEKVGRRLFEKKESFIFRKKNLIRAENFYKKHGSKAVVLARFLPVIRTFVPVVAGVAKMEYQKFLFFNIFGGTLWVLSTILLGYFLGSVVPNMDKYITGIVILIIVVSSLPAFIHFWKDNKNEIVLKLRSIIGKK